MASELSSAQRALKVVELLATDVLRGKSNKDLCAALNAKHNTMSGTLSELEALGWSEKLPNGNWRVTAEVGRLAERIASTYQEEYLRLKIEQERFLGGVR